MYDFEITPNGDLINLEHVEFIKVEYGRVYCYTENRCHDFELTAEWKRKLTELSVRGKKNMIDTG